MTNPRNLGFVGSINRALKNVDAGDVILLNADTIVPPGSSIASRRRPEALPTSGRWSRYPTTVNFLAFRFRRGQRPRFVRRRRYPRQDRGGDHRIRRGGCPKRHRLLPLHHPRLPECGRIALGKLPARLSGRRRFLPQGPRNGFRSVCAPSVYVGHEGSRSFKSEKRSLVVRNLQVLDGKFPNYRQECSAFVAADPLRPAREAIERALPACGKRPKISSQAAERCARSPRHASAPCWRRSNRP